MHCSDYLIDNLLPSMRCKNYVGVFKICCKSNFVVRKSVSKIQHDDILNVFLTVHHELTIH